MRGSIKRGQTPHNSRALTLPASVYAGKRENGKIINVEKVRHRAVHCSGSKDKYHVFCILEPEVSCNFSGSGWPCPRRATPREIKNRYQLQEATRPSSTLRIRTWVRASASSIGRDAWRLPTEGHPTAMNERAAHRLRLRPPGRALWR
jgi:hypothetical protein